MPLTLSINNCNTALAHIVWSACSRSLDFVSALLVIVYSVNINRVTLGKYETNDFEFWLYSLPHYAASTG